MENFKILSVILYGLIASEGMVMGRQDCNPQNIIGNVIRVCKSYASIKRSTQGSSFDFDNMLHQWPQLRQRQPPPPFSNLSPFYIDRDRYSSSRMDSWNPFLNFQPRSQRRYPEMPIPFASYKQERKDGGIFNMDKSNEWNNRDFEDLFNPLYWDEEYEITVERWRRNEQMKEEIHKFIQDKCCRRGCAFPMDFLEFDRRTNICNLR